MLYSSFYQTRMVSNNKESWIGVFRVPKKIESKSSAYYLTFVDNIMC